MELLGSADVEVDLASNGEEGVRRVQEKAYGLVLMDLQMPVMDGFEATRRIRALPGFERLPILAMTANAMAGDRERSLAAGMNDHVTKPIDPDALFEALLRWLPRGGLRAPAAAPAAPPPGGSPPRPGRARGAGLAADDPLATVPGLDAADGLRRVLGKREAYVGLLRTFASGQAGAPDAIRAALAEGRRADAERAAHTLKGVAGSIGARAAAGRGGRGRGGAAPGRAGRRGRGPARAGRDDARRPPRRARRRGAAGGRGARRPGRSTPQALRAAVERIERLLEQDDVEAVGALDEAAPAPRRRLRRAGRRAAQAREGLPLRGRARRAARGRRPSARRAGVRHPPLEPWAGESEGILRARRSPRSGSAANSARRCRGRIVRACAARAFQPDGGRAVLSPVLLVEWSFGAAVGDGGSRLRLADGTPARKGSQDEGERTVPTPKRSTGPEGRPRRGVRVPPPPGRGHPPGAGAATRGREDGRRAGGGRGEAPARAARLPRGADRALPRPAPRPDPRGVHLPARDHPAPAVAGEEPEPQGQGPRRRRGQAALGPGRPVDGGLPGRRQAARRRHPVDDGPRQRLPRAAERRHGRRPADAQEGEGQQRPGLERAAEGRDQGHRDEGSHRHRAGEARR